MNWKNEVISALFREDMFENTDHYRRFRELITCYRDYPFFSKGLCKCMYLSAWDEEHFAEMLIMLGTMTIDHQNTTREMQTNGKLMEEELSSCHKANYLIYEMANAFLEDRKFVLRDPESVPTTFVYIIRKALKAADIIDALS